MSQQITVEIDSTGATTVTTTGFAGAACKQATAALEKALGNVTRDERTPEFYQQQNANRPQQAKAEQ